MFVVGFERARIGLGKKLRSLGVLERIDHGLVESGVGL